MRGYVREDLLIIYKLSPKMIAIALLGMYDKMAVEYEEKKKPTRGKSIQKVYASIKPVLLLRKEGKRQYFFVPGGVSPK